MVADAMKVLDEEVQTAMRLLGANTVDQLGTQHVGFSCPCGVQLKAH